MPQICVTKLETLLPSCRDTACTLLLHAFLTALRQHTLPHTICSQVSCPRCAYSSCICQVSCLLCTCSNVLFSHFCLPSTTQPENESELEEKWRDGYEKLGYKCADLLSPHLAQAEGRFCPVFVAKRYISYKWHLPRVYGRKLILHGASTPCLWPKVNLTSGICPVFMAES